MGAGDTAQWVRSAGGGAGVSNVINRVTGGQVSQIAGTLDSTGLPNANFYFINPAGIVFSTGARVNVPSAAYFSTAGELRFADATKFAIATPGGSTLSIAAPQSFGFVGGQGAISINGVAQDFAPPSAALSFAASDVQVANAHLLQRGLDLTAVGPGAAQVSLLDPTATPTSGRTVTHRHQPTHRGTPSGAQRPGRCGSPAAPSRSTPPCWCRARPTPPRAAI